MFIQEKPCTQGFDEAVCIGVPIAKGNTDPPPPLTAAQRGGTTHLVSESSVDQESTCRLIVKQILFVICFLSIWGLALLFDTYANHPSFKVESVSVSLQHNSIKSDDSQVTTAEWNIGVSVENSNQFWSFDYQVFDVWVLCMYQSFPITVSPLFSQGPKNTTFLNATKSALLPDRDLPVSISGLEFDVVILAKYRDPHKIHTVEGVCMGMRAGFSWNATKGILVGGPRACSSIYD